MTMDICSTMNEDVSPIKDGEKITCHLDVMVTMMLSWKRYTQIEHETRVIYNMTLGVFQSVRFPSYTTGQM